MRYETPVVVDYGTLVELTEAMTFFGTEDGGNKFDTVDHHSLPVP